MNMTRHTEHSDHSRVALAGWGGGEQVNSLWPGGQKFIVWSQGREQFNSSLSGGRVGQQFMIQGVGQQFMIQVVG